MNPIRTIWITARAQQGAVLMVMLVIMVIGAATFLVGSLTHTNHSLMHATQTSDVLAQAKAALIGYALSDVARPGELPCPDTHAAGTANVGTADSLSGGNCSGGNLGRLPWKTLGLSELRDANGETLWYAVSDPYHAGASNALNSDTTGTISVSGNTSANGLVAIIFSPGKPLPNQNRTAANYSNFAHYLESVVTSPIEFQLSAPNDTPNGSFSYNDQIKWISRDDLMPSVEKVVLKQFKDSGFFSNYYGDWQAYPFAATFDDPTISNHYIGTSGITYGLLPVAKQIGANPQRPHWNALPTCTDMSGITIGIGSLRTSSNNSCTPPSSSCVSARCTFFSPLAAGTAFKMTGTMDNVGFGFWRLFDKTAGAGIGASGSDTCALPSEICVRLNSNDKYYPASDKLNNVSITGQFDAGTNIARITLLGTTKPGSSNTINRIQFAINGMQEYTLPTWYKDNDWQQVMYYAVSPGYAPGGGNNCIPSGTPTCLTVNGHSGGNDKQAILITTGSALVGQSRSSAPSTFCSATGTAVAPNACLTNYLELENATPADFVYENKTRSGTFNDQGIVISP